MRYTLILINEDKTVNCLEFDSLSKLFDYKRFSNKKIAKEELNEVDKDGYIWSVEIPSV